MRSVRWRWMLILMSVLVGGCLPREPATTVMPASFLEVYGGTSQETFTAQAPPIGENGQDVVEALRAADTSTSPMFRSRAIPVFGVVHCAGVPDCQPGPAGGPGPPSRAVWVVIYPDWVGPGGDVGWALVDAVAGLAAGYEWSDPRGP